MSYADPAAPMSTRKLTSIIVVIALHAVVLFLMVTGGYKTVVKHISKLTVLDIAPPPPPPPLPPPPPPPPAPPQTQSPPVVSPPTIVPVPSPPVQVQAVAVAPPAPVTPTVTPPAPPSVPAGPPAPPAVATPIKVKGDPNSWFTDADYPAEAKRDNVVGNLSVHLQVDASGKVTDCSVTTSSGSAALDQTACRLLIRRGRFYPAKDAGGTAISAPYSFRFTWRLTD